MQKKSDIMAPVTEIFDHFAQNCKALYTTGCLVTFEVLINF
jgi:hypothetical protein